MSTSTKLAQQLRRISAEWPNDPLRPNIQLKTFLNSLADYPKLTPAAVTAAQVLQENRISKKVRSFSFLTRSRHTSVACHTAHR